MIDRPELIKDIIDFYVGREGYTVIGQALVDVISGDLWDNYEPGPVDITVHTTKQMFTDTGNIHADFAPDIVLPDITTNWQTTHAGGGFANLYPVLGDGEEYIYAPIGVQFVKTGEGLIPPVTSNIDVMRLQMKRAGLSGYRAGMTGVIKTTADVPLETVGQLILNVQSKRFNILGALTPTDQETVGKLINRGWSCPPEQIEQFQGALNHILAVPIPGVDAAGVLPDIAPHAPANVLEPIPTIPVFKVPDLPHAFPVAPDPGGYAIDPTPVKGKRVNTPGLTRAQRTHEAEIFRVRERTENFLATHMTPDEKVGAAHGQDIGEFAQVYDANQAGFGGNDGWT